jgi:hypothetical protein
MNKEIKINSLQEEIYNKKINIDEYNYKIEIKDSTENLKNWIICLEKSISNGNCLSLLKDDIDNLDQIISGDPKADYTFPSNERIYFSNKEIKYIPNAYSNWEKEIIFNLMKKNLEKAKIYFSNGMK